MSLQTRFLCVHISTKYCPVALYELTDFLFNCSAVIGNPPLPNMESQYKFILHLGLFVKYLSDSKIFISLVKAL